MTFPQPNLTTPLLNYGDYARLITPLQSPGDIYESEVGFKAIGLGPQSDLGRVRVTYFDPIAANNVNSIVLTPQYPFPSNILSRMDQTYPLSARKGRILFSSDDVYDPNFLPSTFSAGNDRIAFVPPVMDVMGYYSSPPASLVGSRGDKELFFEFYDVPTPHVFFLVIPTYSRKLIELDLLNRNQLNTNTYGILGVNFATTDATPTYHLETVIRAPAAVAANGRVTTIIKASSQGQFDAIVISVNDAGPAPLRVFMSDTAL